ncbi:MAG: hypothetical protein E6K35_02455 [Gammaproteobacteria bacterium]|nr:MAG: hypothetical protein E6K47_00405 [Gammaproteobacteria bacterium]TLY88215.1 MAG: hypothetical protein E6K35_02455 [Gammaproteobacteria bacterium]
MRHVPARCAWAWAAWLAIVPAYPQAWAAVSATGVSMSQKNAALEFLQAVASGDPEAVAFAIHPDDLRALRLRILTLLHDEAKRGDSTVRNRLFGPARPLDEIEHLTDTGFYATLADRLYLAGREYDGGEGIASIAEKDGKVEVLIRGRQPRERGKVQVLNLVTLKPFGKDWKAALPTEIEAQIEDLIAGRHGTSAAARTPAALRGGGRSTAPAQPGIVELLATSEKLLSEGKCDVYYGKQMSPNFRRVTGKKALATLVAACQNSLGTREMLLATLHIVQGLEPRYEYEGQRATYDLTGQGLPFDHFVLEQVDKHWYVAE